MISLFVTLIFIGLWVYAVALILRAPSEEGTE